MSVNDGYRIEISSDCALFWRYNLAVTCGCFDRSDNGAASDLTLDNRHYLRKDFVAAEDTIAPIGANLQFPPEEYPSERRLNVEAAACDLLRLCIYVIPHSMPSERSIDECRPFDLRVKALFGGSTVCEKVFKVNAWSGASIELFVPRP